MDAFRCGRVGRRRAVLLFVALVALQCLDPLVPVVAQTTPPARPGRARDGLRAVDEVLGLLGRRKATGQLHLRPGPTQGLAHVPPLEAEMRERQVLATGHGVGHEADDGPGAERLVLVAARRLCGRRPGFRPRRFTSSTTCYGS